MLGKHRSFGANFCSRCPSTRRNVDNSGRGICGLLVIAVSNDIVCNVRLTDGGHTAIAGVISLAGTQSLRKWPRLYQATRIGLQTQTGRDFLQVLLHSLVTLAGGDHITKLVVLASQALALLLEGLNIALLLCQLLLQGANLSNRSSLSEPSRVLAAGLLVTLEQLDTILKAEDLQDHDVGAVEDQGEEEGETAQVHVTLRVEFTGLHLHTICTEVGSAITKTRLVVVSIG